MGRDSGGVNIFFVVNAFDYSGYPDCRPEYISASEVIANLAPRAGVEGIQRLKMFAPIIDVTEAQIIQEGLRLGVDYSDTSSCYDPGQDGRPCSACDSCLLHARRFAEARMEDPLYVRHGMT